MVVGARWWWVVMVAMVVVGGDGGHGGEFGWDANELIASELLPVGRRINEATLWQQQKECSQREHAAKKGRPPENWGRQKCVIV